MRKLKLQMQMTTDGFVAGPHGQLDWMTFDKDEKLLALINHLVDTSDTILLGRRMTEGFVNYWEGVKKDSEEYTFAQKMVDTSKIVFSRTTKHVPGKHVRVESGPLVEAVTNLKKQNGKDLLVYGGAGFVSSLIENSLIDELNLFINPIAIGDGLRIFHDRRPMRLIESTRYSSGIVVNRYEPRR